MALFNAAANPTAPPTDDGSRGRGPINPAEQHNIIGKETTIEGTLRAQGNVHISGRVLGNVEVDGRTVVMPGGLVDGEVTTTHAEVGGRVKGHLIVSERLVLKATAVVEGDIRAGKLIIEDGAAFSGRCDMSAAMGTAAPRPPAGRAEAPEPAPRRLGDTSGPGTSGSGASSSSGPGSSGAGTSEGSGTPGGSGKPASS